MVGQNPKHRHQAITELKIDIIERISQKHLKFYGYVIRLDPQGLTQFLSMVWCMEKTKRMVSKEVARWNKGDLKMLNITSIIVASRMAKIREN